MNQSQIALLLFASVLVAFRLFFAYLDVRSGVRKQGNVLLEAGMLVTALLVLSAVFLLEQARSIALLAIVAAGFGHAYGAFRTWRNKNITTAIAWPAVSADLVASGTCAGLVLVSVSMGQTWSELNTTLIVVYLASVGYRYWIRRRADGRPTVEAGQDRAKTRG